jgi:hypothetical protein
MELAQGHMERYLLFTDRSEAVQGKIDAFADTDSRGSHKAESVGLECADVTELLLQTLILFQRKRSGQITVTSWKVFTTNEVAGKRVSLVS